MRMQPRMRDAGTLGSDADLPKQLRRHSILCQLRRLGFLGFSDLEIYSSVT